MASLNLFSIIAFGNYKALPYMSYSAPRVGTEFRIIMTRA